MIKYKDLVWYDPDNNQIYAANSDNMTFQKGKRGCGWCVNGHGEGGDEEPFELALLCGMIAETPQPTKLNVTVVQPAGKKNGSSDSEDST